MKEILEFWKRLSHDDKKSLLTIPSSIVLSSLKSKSRHMCSCDTCGINQEVERLFNQYCDVLRFQSKHLQLIENDPKNVTKTLENNINNQDDEELPLLEDAESQYSSVSTTTITEEEWFDNVTLSYVEPHCMTPESFARYEFGLNIVMDSDKDIISVSDAWLNKHGEEAVKLLKQVEIHENGRMKRTFDDLFTSIVKMNMHERNILKKKRKRLIASNNNNNTQIVSINSDSDKVPHENSEVATSEASQLVDEPNQHKNTSLSTPSENMFMNKAGKQIISEKFHHEHFHFHNNRFHHEERYTRYEIEDNDSETNYYSEDSNSIVSDDEGHSYHSHNHGHLKEFHDENCDSADEGENEYVDQAMITDQEDAKWRETLKLFRMFTAKLLYERIDIAYREELAIKMQQELIREEEKEERLARERKERQRQQKKKKDKKLDPKKKIETKKIKNEVSEEESLKKQQEEERQRKIIQEQQEKIEKERKRVEEMMLEEIARQHLEQQLKLQEESKRQLEIEAEEESKKKEQQVKKNKKRKKKKPKKKNEVPHFESASIASTNEINGLYKEAKKFIPTQSLQLNDYLQSKSHIQYTNWIQDAPLYQQQMNTNRIDQYSNNYNSQPNYPSYTDSNYSPRLSGFSLQDTPKNSNTGSVDQSNLSNNKFSNSVQQSGLNSMGQSSFYSNSSNQNISHLSQLNLFQKNLNNQPIQSQFPSTVFSRPSNIENNRFSTFDQGIPQQNQSMNMLNLNNQSTNMNHLNSMNMGLNSNYGQGFLFQNSMPSSATQSQMGYHWIDSIFSNDSHYFPNSNSQNTSNLRNNSFGSDSLSTNSNGANGANGYKLDEKPFGEEKKRSLDSQNYFFKYGSILPGLSDSKGMWANSEPQWDTTNGFLSPQKQ